MREGRLTSDAGECHKIALVVEALRSTGSLRLKVQGTSMIPTVWPGDVVTVQCTSHDFVIERDIVLVFRDRRLFVHRLVTTVTQESERYWITRGDAMPQNDPPALPSEVLGKVIAVERGRQTLPLKSQSMLTKMLGWTLGNVDVLRGWALRLHAWRYEPDLEPHLSTCGELREA